MGATWWALLGFVTMCQAIRKQLLWLWDNWQTSFDMILETNVDSGCFPVCTTIYKHAHVEMNSSKK